MTIRLLVIGGILLASLSMSGARAVPSSAPADASYLTRTANTTLINERVIPLDASNGVTTLEGNFSVPQGSVSAYRRETAQDTGVLTIRSIAESAGATGDIVATENIASTDVTANIVIAAHNIAQAKGSTGFLPEGVAGQLIDVKALEHAHTNTLWGSYVGAYVEPTASVQNIIGYWVSNLNGLSTGSSYPFWYDGAGSNCHGSAVTRINHLGAFAQYNPCQLHYDPDQPIFERITMRWGNTGTFGVDNTAYIGAEAGGTGISRTVQLIGGGLQLQHTMVAPAQSGARFLCIDTAGRVMSSVTPCAGT